MWRLLFIFLFLSSPLRAEGGTLLSRFWQSSDGLPGNVVLAVGQTEDGFLWVATTEGLARFDGREFERISLPEDFVAQRLRFDRIFTPGGNEVLLSTTRGSLYRVVRNQLVPAPADAMAGLTEKATTSHALPAPYAAILGSPLPPSLVAGEKEVRRWFLTLPENGNAIPINDWLTDREGNLWLASTGHGLVRLKPSRFTYLDQMAGVPIPSHRAALQTKDGAWWLANFNGGVDRLESGVLTHHSPPESSEQNPIIGIHEDSRGGLRFVNEGGRVFVWNEDTMSLNTSDLPDPSSVQIISEDGSGNLILGTPKGVLRIEGEKVTNLSSNFGLRNLRFSFITPHNGGGLLLGTRDGRVILLTEKSAVDLGEPGTFSQNWISGIVQAEGGELWVGTLGSGLFRLQAGTWRSFSQEGNSLPDNRITALHLSGNDEIWCGSLSGIMRIRRQDLEAGNGISYWQLFDHEDGMRTRECIGTCAPSFWKGADGVLWFPTASGLAGMDLDSPAISPTPAPPVYLRKILINGKISPPDAGDHVAGPGASRLEFHFHGINLKSPDKVSYRVCLRGFEENLRMISSPSQAVYEAVPPGEYTFEVTAVNGDGIPSIKPLVVPVTVRPYFWQNTWFILSASVLALIVAVLAGNLVARQRAKRKIATLRLHNALAQERSRIARDLHDDIGATLTELSIISSLAAENHGTTDPREMFEKLASKSRKIVIALDEIVWAVSPEEDTLPSLIEYLEAYGAEFVANAGLIFRSDIPTAIPSVPIGPKRRHHLCMATREALNNAVKHASATVISLHFSIREKVLEVVIEDNGSGFEPDDSTRGDGLGNLRNRLNDCGGSCSISHVPSGGTRVILSIPLHETQGSP